MRVDRGGAMLGMPLRPWTPHIVELGAIGVEERLELAQDVGELGGERGAAIEACSSRQSCSGLCHDVLLSALWPVSSVLIIGRPKIRLGSDPTFGRNSLKTGAYLSGPRPRFDF